MTTQSNNQKNLFVEPRKRLVDWIRHRLVGAPEAIDGEQKLVGVLPTERFPCGALYPITSFGEGIDPASDVDSDDQDLHRA